MAAGGRTWLLEGRESPAMTAVDKGRAGGGAVCGVAPVCLNLVTVLVTVLWLRKRTPKCRKHTPDH